MLSVQHLILTIQVWFNGGCKAHISKFCSHKNKGFIRFKCNSFCPKAYENKLSTQTDSPKLQVGILDSENNSRYEIHKLVKFFGVMIEAVVDTGSNVTFLCEDIYIHNFFDKVNICRRNISWFS